MCRMSITSLMWHRQELADLAYVSMYIHSLLRLVLAWFHWQRHNYKLKNKTINTVPSWFNGTALDLYLRVAHFGYGFWDIRGICQSFQEYSYTMHRLDHCRVLPNLSNSLLSNHPSIWHIRSIFMSLIRLENNQRNLIEGLPYLDYLPIYLSVCLSVCLPVCLSACLPACLSICLSFYLPTLSVLPYPI
jgi:hypothetical protein